MRRSTDSYEGRIGRAAEQPVQLVELAALAFPPDPPPLPVVPDPPAMEQQEAVPAGTLSITAIQAGDTRGGSVEERVISCNGLGRGVRPVREQGEMQLVLRTCKVVDLKTLDLLFESGLGREKDRNGDHRAQVRRYAVAELQARQDRRAEPSRDAAVHERHRGIDRRDQPEKREETKPQAGDSRFRQRKQRQGKKDRSDHDDAADIAADADPCIETTEPAP